MPQNQLPWLSIFTLGDASLPAEAQTAFISYSREDSAFALKLAEDLKAAGAAVWLDQLDIGAGQRWARAVEEALHTCSLMLVILSPHSIDSRNVEDEFAFALEEGKTVIPVLYRDCKIPFRLRQLQRVDFRGDYDLALERLAQTLPADAPTQTISASEEPISKENPAEPAAELERSQGQPAESQRDDLKAVKAGRASLFQALFRFPVWAKVGLAASGIFILGAIFYWAVVGSRQNGRETIGTIANSQPHIPPAKPPSSSSVGKHDAVLQEHGLLHDNPAKTQSAQSAVTKAAPIQAQKSSGRNWTKQSSGVDAWLTSVTSANGQSGWAAGMGGTILHTGNGGRNWTEQSSGVGAWLISVTFANAQSGWAVGDGGTIVHTEDGGRSWIKQSSGVDAQLGSVTFANRRNGWAVGGGGTILHTEDGGRNWNKQSSGVEAHLTSVTFANLQSGWAVGDYSTIVHTEDGGRNWTKQSSGVGAWLSSVTFANTQSGWAVGEKGTIMCTEDGGRNWTKQNSPVSEYLRSVTVANGQSGWAVGHKGTILRYEE